MVRRFGLVSGAGTVIVRQHDEYLNKLRNEGLNPIELVGSGLNHFEILTTFNTADGLLSQAYMKLLTSENVNFEV